ncbi:uncharacterized protein LOC124353484 isoform X2 [Homalodisca vitripennis]|uniref:uncharacterized protein LOC124353484 isoform X2 n=1 Tax=Homalodisca vitripennis TaxID=197043 RepID=UPI001EEBAB2B|nr:uncharacterized protein LOC124353484 isoform X2 [Homalodisca vitripennis]
MAVMSEDIILQLRCKPFSSLPPPVQIDIVKNDRPRPTMKWVNTNINLKDNMHFQDSNYLKFEWLCGSQAMMKTFCWPCLLFTGKLNKSFISHAFFELNLVVATAKTHEKTEVHQKCVESLRLFKRRYGIFQENQESQHEVFIKSESEEVLDIYDDNTVGNFSPSNNEKPDVSDSASQSLSPDKKRKFCHSPLPSGSTDMVDNTVHNIDTSKPETEFDLWARSVAYQLNHMELKRALRLQLKMQTLLSEERINQDCDGVISGKPPSSTNAST